MSEGQIFFGGQIVGKPLVLPTLDVRLDNRVPYSSREKTSMTERCYVNAPDFILLPPVVPEQSSLRLPLTARDRVCNFAVAVSGYSARVSETSKHRRGLPRQVTNPDTLSPQSCGAASGSNSPRHAVFSSYITRPGTEERRSGHIAATDSTSLPKLHSSICKADVQVASESLAFAERLAAEHRHECWSKANKRDRTQAQKWLRNRKQQLQKEQEIERELKEKKREEAVAEAKLAADSRWKRAFERIRTRAIIEPANTRTLARGNTMMSTAADQGSESAKSTPVEADDSPRSAPLGAHKMFRSLTWRAKDVPLDMHIEVLRKLRKLKNRATRSTQNYETRKMRYARLPEDERYRCESAFKVLFGSDPFSRSLDMFNVRDCLYEVGARGISLEEQIAVFKICDETFAQSEKLAKSLKQSCQSETDDEISQEARMAAARGGINLYTFAVELLPAARRQLQSMREEKIEEEFALRDQVGSGYISVEKCMDIIRHILHADVERDVVESRAKQLAEELEFKEREKRACQEADDDSIVAQMHKLREAKREAEEKSKHQNQLSLEIIKVVVLELAASEERNACARERKVQAEIGIERETFRTMRYDLPLIHRLFAEQSPDLLPLSRDECARVFREFGMPTGVCRHHVGSGGIDFDDLLHLVEQIRLDVESDAFNNLRELFDEYAGCNQLTRRLPAIEVYDFLRSVRMTGGTDIEKEGLERALDTVFATYCHEEDTFSFEQVRRALQRMQEFVRREQHREEVEVAHSCGFEEMELEELHDTFHMLDSDGSGTIELEEAWSAIKSLGFCMSKAAIRLAYTQIDDANSGTLDFVNFLRLLEFLRRSEGDFCDRKVGKLADLLKPEMLHLLTLLHTVLEGEPDDIDEKILLKKLADSFRIKATDPLEKMLHVRTFNELCARAGDLQTGS